MARYKTAAEIINATASECGLTAVSDPFASLDPAFIQMVNICSTAGQELVGMHEWQKLTKEHSFTTTTSTEEALPENFSYMIDQTQWDRTAGFPLGGPMTSQTWAYLLGDSLGLMTIYVVFKIEEGVMKLLPDPMVAGKTIAFNYISRNWVQKADASFADVVAASDDVVLFEPILMIKFLKLRFLEAKGFDTTAAMSQFITQFNSWTGKDVTAPVLSMARRSCFPYLGYRNIPDTGYGS